MKKSRAVALIMILGFLIITCAAVHVVLILFQSQNAITRSLMQVDEVRYAEEIGLRHGLWVWRYRYDDPAYLNNGTQVYETTLDINSYNVESVKVRVEDKNSDRKLDEGEIETQVNKVSWGM